MERKHPELPYRCLMSTARYERFPDRTYFWDGPAEFLEQDSWADGIHVITLRSGSSIDVLLRGEPARRQSDDAQPVFFTGAVHRSAGQPPFFSGGSITRELDIPLIAIADPTLTPENDLTIGWYTGLAGDDAQRNISSILERLREWIGRELLLVGGSAGGFASLYFASELGTTAFVWNPQTNLLKYTSGHVREYLSTITGDPTWATEITPVLRNTLPVDEREAEQSLLRLGIAWEIRSVEPISRLLYLQNESDHHEPRHAAPLRARDQFREVSPGVHVRSEKLVAVGAFETGHRAPGRPIIEKGLQMMIEGNSPSDTARELFGLLA